MNKIDEILTYLQPFLIIYALTIFIKKWKSLHSFKWLIIIPLAGLLQYTFSVLIGPTIIGLQEDSKMKLSTYKLISSYNLIFIAAYSLFEYYAILRFFELHATAIFAKKSIKLFSNLTIAITSVYLLFIPTENIVSKKMITVVLSFQLIFFSIYILSELVFKEIDENLLKNPTFLITGTIFILFSSTCPIYYLSNYFVMHSIPASNILNLVILISYTFFYSVLIYTLKWIKI